MNVCDQPYNGVSRFCLNEGVVAGVPCSVGLCVLGAGLHSNASDAIQLCKITYAMPYKYYAGS